MSKLNAIKKSTSTNYKSLGEYVHGMADKSSLSEQAFGTWQDAKGALFTPYVTDSGSFASDTLRGAFHDVTSDVNTADFKSRCRAVYNLSAMQAGPAAQVQTGSKAIGSTARDALDGMIGSGQTDAGFGLG